MNVALCPDRERLESYALGKLAPDDLDSVAEHLLACPNCDSVVESLESVSDSLVHELRKPALEDQLELEPELRQSLEALRDGPPQPPTRQIDASPLAVAEGNKTTDLGSVREYRLLEKIGQGGMGTVYKAVHSRLKRVVAIKLLPEDRMHDEASIRRFTREMEAVGKLEHPNIVKALDAGEDEGRHYLVIEYVEGTNLRTYIKSKGKLTSRQTAHIGFYVARALEHANEHGIIHRDVKPSNILLSTSGKIKLADLGLAKFFDDSSRPVASSTLAGELLGSIDYLAPEQAQDATQADTRSDIYALGCTLYHCLTGRPPFVEGTNVQKIMAHIEKEPEEILDLNPDVPEQLAELIHTRMLAKRPEDRFQTPREVALALKPWAGKATPVQARSAARVVDSGSTHSQGAGSVGTLADLSALELGETSERPTKDRPQRRRAGRIRGLRRKSRVADYLERTRALLNDWKVIGQYVLAESAREPTARDLQRYLDAREGILLQYDSLLPILQRRSGPGGHQTIAACAELASLYEVEELGVKRRKKLRDDWQRGHNYLVDFLVFLEQVRARLNSLNPVSYAVGAAWDMPAVRPVAALLLFLAGGYYLSGVVLKVNTSIGTLVLEFDQPETAGAIVLIDDKATRFIITGGDQEPVEIRVDEGRRMLKVTKQGFETFTREFTISANGRQIIRVHLESASSLDKSPGPVVKRPVPQLGERPSTPFVSEPPAKTVLKTQVNDPEVWQPAPALYGGVARRDQWSTLKSGTMVTLDPSSGRATALGFPDVVKNKPFGVTGLAFSSRGELFASVYARDGEEEKMSIPPTLIGVDPDTGTLLGKIGKIRDARGRPVKITDLAMQPETDVLFGIGGGAIGKAINPPSATGAAKLYRIDTSTAVATLVRDTRRSFGGAIAFSPTGTLYHCTFMGPYSPTEKRKPALTVLDPASGRSIKTIPLQDGTKITHLIVPRGLAVRPGNETVFLSMNYTLLRKRPNTELQNNLLVTIDPETGMVTPLATSVQDVRNRIGDLAFRPGKAGEQVAGRSKSVEPVARNRAGSTLATPIPRGTFIVNSTVDPGDGVCDARECTLREAIAAANKKRGVDTIAFAIPGDGPHRIQPTSPLPEITDAVIIDGTTQTGFTGAPIIVLNGSSAGVEAEGLVITADNVIEENYIGTRVTGTAPLGNKYGVSIAEGAHSNLIGTDSDGVADEAELRAVPF